MTRFVVGDDRSQSTLFPERLDDYLGEDNPVRAIDVFVDELDLLELGFGGVEPEATGRPAYHPATLLKIYIYGYLNRVLSSRRLERECLSFPNIISARNDDVIRTEPVWRRRSRIARRLALAARPCLTLDVCASHYNRPSTRSAPAANVVRQRSGRDPSSRAEASRPGVQHRGSARATSVKSGGPVSP